MIKKNLGPVTAYALAVKNGFEGTEREWLESLKGIPEWSLVQNKPVEYESIGDTITWDGNEEGVITASFPVWFLVHELTEEDVAALRANPDLLKQAKGIDADGTERLYWRTRGEAVEFDKDAVIVALENDLDKENMGQFIFPKRGVYFYKGSQSDSGGSFMIQTASFTVPGFEFHKEILKPDYVPYAVTTKPQSLTEQQQMQARKNLGLPYSEGGIVEILPETTIEGTDDSGDGVPDTFMLTQTLDLVAGKTYVVKYNGVDYECVCQDASALVGGIFCVAMGDMSEMGLSGDGEPFMLLYSPDGFSAIGYTGQVRGLDGATSITLAIYHNAETIHKLDNKYIDAEWMATTKKVKGELIADNDSDISEYPEPKLELGKKYTVTWDGVDYDCVGLDSGDLWNGAIYLGNLSAVGGAGNGEPFVIIEVEGDFEGNHTLLVAMPDLGDIDGHTFAIHTAGEVSVNKLPAKFLPEGVPYSEGNLVELLPETEVEISGDTGEAPVPGNVILEVGKTYTIKYIGSDYVCVGQDLSETQPGAVGLGNLAYVDLDDTGEPFMLAYAPDSGLMLRDYFSTESGVGQLSHVAIYEGAETVHKLNKKLLPTIGWNTVEGKPFGKVDGSILTWDGDTEGRVTVDFGSGVLCKVSDVVLSLSDFENGFTVEYLEDGYVGVWPFPKEEAVEVAPGVIACSGYFSVVERDNVEVGGLVFPKAGIYFELHHGYGHCSALIIPDFTGFAHDVLDKKSLPVRICISMYDYENHGILEVYPDGSEVITTIEFDDSGNPVKFTDSLGNVTEVAW